MQGSGLGRGTGFAGLPLVRAVRACRGRAVRVCPRGAGFAGLLGAGRAGLPLGAGFAGRPRAGLARLSLGLRWLALRSGPCGFALEAGCAKGAKRLRGGVGDAAARFKLKPLRTSFRKARPSRKVLCKALPFRKNLPFCKALPSGKAAPPEAKLVALLVATAMETELRLRTILGFHSAEGAFSGTKLRLRAVAP